MRIPFRPAPRPIVAAALAVLGAATIVRSAHASTTAPGATDTVVAIVDVSVVPMDRERTVAGQTVIVRDGRIERIGAAGEVSVPAGALRIDGRGKYVMPGLVDMHAHFQAGEGLLTDPAGRQIALNLANGVTTVRGLGVAPQNGPAALALRERVRRGEITAPAMVVYAPSIHGQNTTTPAQARERVREAKAAGYDGIKTHGGFDAGVYDALVDEARRVGIPVAGHVTPGFGLERAAAAGQQIEHLDGFLAALMPAGGPVPQGQMIADPADLARVDEGGIAALAAAMKRSGSYHGPTLALFENVMSDETGATLATRPEMRYSPPQAVAQWTGQKDMQIQNGAPAEGRRRFLELRRTIVRELHEAGVPLLSGSDSPQFFMVPGFALHREMQALVEAGLSPYAALETATRVPAEHMGLAAEIGTVAEGMRADLVLVDADPLADVRNAQRVSGVMVAGRWIPAEALQRRLEELERIVKG